MDQTMVSILTGRGMSAIASVALAGHDAEAILAKVFRAGGDRCKGSVDCGWIVDGDRIIDEVLVGAEGAESFVVHCHGNPLLIEQIATLLQSHGANLVDADAFWAHRNRGGTMIEAEARMAMRKSATLTGAKILQAQIDGGLCAWAKEVLANVDAMDADTLQQQCKAILHRSRIARRIIEGVRVVIAGPPNSGKSTLLNRLAGQEQVIVSETAGTTRDWVSVMCLMDPVRVEFIDTAGLDDGLAGRDDLEQMAQGVTYELLNGCDLILYVQDILAADRPPAMGDGSVPVLSVYNKCDLAGERDGGDEALCMSAQCNIGIDLLGRRILETLDLRDFAVNDPVAFTRRQCEVLSLIAGGGTDAKTGLSELLYAKDAE